MNQDLKNMDKECDIALPESIQSKEKLFYSMGETSEMFHLPPSTLRFWEKEFDLIKPRKNKKGDRFFSKNDIILIRTIYYLTKIKGYTLQGAKNVLKNNTMQEAETANIVSILTDIKQMLLNIKKELD